MLGEDIYRDFVVRSAEITKETGRNNRTMFLCHLEGTNGHKVAFDLTIEGCSGEKHYRAQYDAVAKLCSVGALLHCGIVYRRRCDAFVMCIDQMMLLKPVRDNGSQIDADDYLNPRRGFWVRTVPVGDWVDIPGVIELGGESCIPLVEEDQLPLVAYRHRYDHGLHYGKRRNALQRVWNWVFAT